MKKVIFIAFIGACTLTQSIAQEKPQESSTDEVKWLIEPLKFSSLMVNTHPEYNGWGFEAGRRISDHLWVTSMIESTQGGDFSKNFDPNYDYLVNFKYFAWLNVIRYYRQPNASYSTFFDGGFEVQRATQKFLRNNAIYEESATSAGPILLIGGEWRFAKNIYLKWRAGALINIYRGGSMDERINDGQDQPSFYMYPHLSDAVLNRGSFAGDVALGIKL